MSLRILIGCSALAIFCCSASTCVAQPQEVLEEITGGGFRRPSTSITNIYSTLQFSIETKNFQEKNEFGDFVKKFAKAISKKGKDVQIVVDHEAFMGDKRQRLFILGGEVTLPPVPSKMVANTAFRLALSQVGEGKATYWFRKGQIVITSAERARSAHFLKTSIVEADVKNRPLTDVLEHLAEQSGVSIIIDARVSNKARTTVTAKVNGKLETVVRLLTDAAGLKHVVAGNMIYVTSPANADRFAEISSGPMDGAIAIDEIRCRNQPLLEAVGEWSTWVLDSRVKQKANIRVTARWLNQVEPDTAIRILTDMAGLRHVVVDDVVYITDAANAKKLMDEESRKKPGK